MQLCNKRPEQHVKRVLHYYLPCTYVRRLWGEENGQPNSLPNATDPSSPHLWRTGTRQCTYEKRKHTKMFFLYFDGSQ